MAYNFLAPRASENARSSDTLSEISETGTATSGWETRDELRELVIKIGLNDVSDLYQERFRVDRKKLEQMLSGDSEAPLPADIFFEQIMADTETYISWPNKLKIGAKSKKDPHVRVAGRPEDVQAAKERIMTVLDTRCNRVTMKMDVSYTDHSHIIGKSGLSIKRVMAETQCHVHFPDSNRSNPTEKSNQVSISGDIEGVECARSRVRELIPLMFGFELPIMSRNVDGTTPYVIKVQEQYKVQVMFKTRPKLHATLVLVKGVEWELEQVKRATLLLMDYLCENLASQISVQMSMEISPHHHPVVTGKNHSNLKLIMSHTNCQIMFPDAQDPNIPSLKKSNVNITGNIHDVYRARQMLMGCLPILIIFDLPEDTSSLKIQPLELSALQTDFDLVINIRQKAKMNTRACVIKGIERNLSNIYKARHTILGIDGPSLNADIPPSYQMPDVAVPLSTDNRPQLTINPPPMSPLLSPMMGVPLVPPSSPFPQSAPFVGMIQQPQFMYNMLHGSIGSSGYQSVGQGSTPSVSLEHSRDNSNYSSISSISSAASPMGSPRNISPSCQQAEKIEQLSSILSEMNSCTGYHGPTVDKRQEGFTRTPTDYEQKRISAIRAMQNRPSGAFRVPNNAWSGYGISHTSPANMGRQKVQGYKKEEDIWKSPHSVQEEVPSTSGVNMNTSNYLDHTPTNTISRITNNNWTDLPTMLTAMGLEKYISLFMSHEVDLATFPSLTDRDLIEMGITALGARRKMLLMISEFNRRSSPFCAAPGAERKNSLNNSNNSPRDNW